MEFEFPKDHKVRKFHVKKDVGEPSKAPVSPLEEPALESPPQSAHSEPSFAEAAPLSKEKMMFLFDQQKLNSQMRTPVLFLIRQNKEVDIIEGVVSGVLDITDSKGLQRKILLSADKLCSVRWGGAFLSCWFANEEDASVYPQEIEHDSREVHRLVASLLQSIKDYESQALSGWADLLFKGAIGLGILLALSYMFGGGLIPSILGQKAAEAAPVVAQNVTNVTLGVVP